MTQSTIISIHENHQVDQTSFYRRLNDIPTPKNVLETGTLSFREIKYILDDSVIDNFRRDWCTSSLKAEPSKRILDDISGIFKTGMNAIMGPTGCGKSSLIDVLAGRKDPKGLSGDIFLDGLPKSSSFKFLAGYVVQEDIVCGTLTVRENIMFSANVRLRPDVSLKERQERVEEVIEQLGLESCANTRMGTEFSRGVSGGERKRTCIAIELILRPKILFLDEPTTGLDASTARSVMEYLKTLSKRGRTIIFSIHQPRYSIFKLFDQVILMCKGKIVYHDTAKHVLPYFFKQGYKREENDNPADFTLDILIDANQNEDILYKLLRSYKRSPIYNKILFDIDEQIRLAAVSLENIDEKKLFKKPFGRELYYISKRTLTNTIRNPLLFASQTIVAIIVGLLVGLVFFNIPKTPDIGVQNRLGAIFLIVTSQIFVTMTAIEPLIKERALFIHENISGYYRISTYFFTKIVCDIIPLRILPSMFFSIIVYFMIGLDRNAEKFFIFLLTVFICNIFGSAICFFFSALVPIFAVALIIVVLVFVIMMVFSGFIVNLASLYTWISWIRWISAFRYASNLLAINEFRGINFCLANMTSVCPTNGTDILNQNQIAYQTYWDKWENLFAITVMAAGFFLLAFIQLIIMKKTK